MKKTSNEKLFLRMLVSAALAAGASAHADTAPVAADAAKGGKKDAKKK